MNRSSCAKFLILAMLWQALVWLTPWGQDQSLTDLSNTFAHAQAASLNDQVDHSAHINNCVTDGPQQHHSSDAFQFIGPMPETHGFHLNRADSSWFIYSQASFATVFLQGPLRPPETGNT
jgi:hypothetical protein